MRQAEYLVITLLQCNEQTLRNFIRYLICSNKLQFHASARTYQKVPELPFGKQMQLDFGQYRMGSGLTLYIFLKAIINSIANAGENSRVIFY